MIRYDTIRYDTIEEFNVDSKAACVQLNLAHVDLWRQSGRNHNTMEERISEGASSRINL